MKKALFDGPFGIQQNVQTLINGHLGELQTVVNLHELLGSQGEGGVHLGVAIIRAEPELGVAHAFQEFPDFILFIFFVGHNF